jgi:hypothetical protein
MVKRCVERDKSSGRGIFLRLLRVPGGAAALPGAGFSGNGQRCALSALIQFRNHYGLVKIARSGFPWGKPRKSPLTFQDFPVRGTRRDWLCAPLFTKAACIFVARHTPRDPVRSTRETASVALRSRRVAGAGWRPRPPVSGRMEDAAESSY